MKGILRSYVKDKIITILLLCGSVLIYCIIFMLYDLSPEYYLYPAVLCLVFWLSGMSVSLYLYTKRHRARMIALGSVDATLDHMPVPVSLTEQDYHKLMETVFAGESRHIAENDAKMGELFEYITLWSHQMKTPITAMGLIIQELDSEQSSVLEAQLFEMERYVDNLLQYLRLDVMNNDFMFQTYQLEMLVKQAVKYYSKTFIMKHLTLKLYDLDCEVVTDEKWLLFCIKQLLSNALKYTIEGSIAIHAEGRTLIIEDTGIGIHEEDVPRVFEKGYTGYNGRLDKRATGIGLYLTKKILDKMGHPIKLESRWQEGTTVSIDLSNLTKS